VRPCARADGSASGSPASRPAAAAADEAEGQGGDLTTGARAPKRASRWTSHEVEEAAAATAAAAAAPPEPGGGSPRDSAAADGSDAERAGIAGEAAAGLGEDQEEEDLSPRFA
jgi:hypothetical protein